MHRAILTVCLLASVTQAAPKYDRSIVSSANPAWVAAEKAWTAAAIEKDLAKAAAAWEIAASAFLAIAEDASVPRGVQQNAIHAAILAWKNALDLDPRIKTPSADKDWDKDPTPRPLDARDTAMLRAFALYLTFAPPPDEAATVKLMRGNILRRRDRLAEAIPIYLDVIEHHRDHEVAEYAANLVLDSYKRLQRYDEMIAFTTKLRTDTAFLATKPDLADTVRKIHAQALRVRGDHLETEARAARDLATYDTCGEAYLAMAEAPGVRATEQAEVLYNAAVCFHQAGSMPRAVATYRLLIKKHPNASLVGRAMARLGKAEADVAHYREAVETLRLYVMRYPAEKDAPNATSDAVYYALALGDLPGATQLADFAIKTFGAKHQALATEALLVVLDAQLAAGKRTDAARRATSAIRSAFLQRLENPALALRAGRLVASAACPVALADDLCPRARDRALVANARRMFDLAREPAANQRGLGLSPDEAAVIADRATHAALDLDLEAVLATKVLPLPPPRGGAGTIGPPRIPGADAVEASYQRLTTMARADLRVAAHARLGALHRHLGDRDKALAALHACVAEARATTAGSEWLARCERDLAAMKDPDLDILPERLAPPAAGTISAVEVSR